MKKQYKDIDEFTKDIEEESLRDYVIDTGILSKKDFRGMFVSCLFHPNDHSPSLQIMPQFYKCYACDSKGGFISFIMQRNGLTFMEAVNELCEYFGCKIENMRSENTEKRNKIDLEWQMYLNDMAKAPKEIQDFKADYWPIDIGYDKRINYLVLPFTSKTGAILGFTKRVIGPVEHGIRPKWKHSSFQEGLQGSIHNIFNLGSAIQEINKKKTIIVSEGPKDVIAFRRINKQNVICVCGTSNSRNVWDEFTNVENVIIAYDADDAGIHATISTVIELVKSYEIQNIEIVLLPKGKDPYDVSKEELEKAYDEREKVIDFVTANATKEELKELYNSTMLHNKFKIIASACKTKNMSSQEVESWMNSTRKKEFKRDDSQKDILLAIVNGTDGIKHTVEEVNKASRMLKLKYKIEV